MRQLRIAPTCSYVLYTIKSALGTKIRSKPRRKGFKVRGGERDTPSTRALEKIWHHPLKAIRKPQSSRGISNKEKDELVHSSSESEQ